MASTLHSLCQDCIRKFPSQHCIKDQHCAEHMFPGIPVATFVEYLFLAAFGKYLLKLVSDCHSGRATTKCV